MAWRPNGEGYEPEIFAYSYTRVEDLPCNPCSHYYPPTGMKLAPTRPTFSVLKAVSPTPPSASPQVLEVMPLSRPALRDVGVRATGDCCDACANVARPAPGFFERVKRAVRGPRTPRRHLKATIISARKALDEMERALEEGQIEQVEEEVARLEQVVSMIRALSRKF